jgi:hypothetical protein
MKNETIKHLDEASQNVCQFFTMEYERDFIDLIPTGAIDRLFFARDLEAFLKLSVSDLEYLLPRHFKLNGLDASKESIDYQIDKLDRLNKIMWSQLNHFVKNEDYTLIGD